MLFRVAILQYPIAWADKDSNLALAERRIRRLKGKAELALMPEMFSTGFCTDRPDLAEDSDGRTIQRLKRLSHETGIAIVSSFICREETETHLNGQSQIQTQLYNRGFFIRPDGEVTFIDKAHLYARRRGSVFCGRTRPNDRGVPRRKTAAHHLLRSALPALVTVG